ncbi:MAG: thymidine phosphorylase [candidate division WOR-3 bacterium]|nr:MAG: thymidine phosphorylase [candidate division WOR-3 bacterium]
MNIHFNPAAIIRKKRDGERLSAKEIGYLISEYTKGNIPDYQISAFLMAAYLQGLDPEETTHLMRSMMGSGAMLDLSRVKAPRVDKHSTGGVGDKVSLILAPLIASCGVCVPMISGRGLGHTGGTLDKLESIPGFRTDLTSTEFERQLRKIGVAMIGQTVEIAPADKKIYALRDVTATVDSIPLIAASIMSKKLAEDLNGLVLDVKFGNGAFMPEYRRAKQLAQTLVQIGRRSGVKTVAVLTSMCDPLGVNVGNSLEVIEAIECLKGRGPEDLIEVTLTLGTEMLKVARIRAGAELLRENLEEGAALHKFREMIECQGGNTRIIEDYSHLPLPEHTTDVLARKTGFIYGIDSFSVGMLLIELGGGRKRKEDSIDASCGFKILKKTGARVKKGTCLSQVLADDRATAQHVAHRLEQAFSIKDRPPRHTKLVREIVK